MEPNDIDYSALSSQQLEDLRDGAQAELRRRVHHHAGDGCVVHDPDEEFLTDAGVTVGPEELGDDDTYRHDGRWYRIEDIEPVVTDRGTVYHVERVLVDD